MIKQVLKFPGGNKCRSRLQYQLDAEAVPVSVLAVAPITSAYCFISFAFAYFVWSRKVLKSRWIYLPHATFISALRHSPLTSRGTDARYIKKSLILYVSLIESLSINSYQKRNPL